MENIFHLIHAKFHHIQQVTDIGKFLIIISAILMSVDAERGIQKVGTS